jgi:hypothetical protein
MKIKVQYITINIYSNLYSQYITEVITLNEIRPTAGVVVEFNVLLSHTHTYIIEGPEACLGPWVNTKSRK